MKKKRKEIICRWDADAYFTASSGLLLHAENDLDRERQRGWLGVRLQAVHLLPLPLFFASSSLLRLCKGKTGLSVCSSQSSGYYSFAVRLQHPLALSTVYESNKYYGVLHPCTRRAAGTGPALLRLVQERYPSYILPSTSRTDPANNFNPVSSTAARLERERERIEGKKTLVRPFLCPVMALRYGPFHLGAY
ncbi:uncharacterized protein ARB_04069 [Trichophyton benhamiae CBS 112371]|uniref:Uncharacterized protein n=1 Tax=Arthroderma benhamiae (strain ATCC MYA-4681 / CBS 112371) TaxID=663331 RepID=D4AIH4_ARTBC|nr:uncharacterized protein ARB_04069 [Trichophyton benhamiae CBS 112371]EFE36547.1 hypothetical protein ARB_04069 [Trichophyton benhamiae CBS 112371]